MMAQQKQILDDDKLQPEGTATAVLPDAVRKSPRHLGFIFRNSLQLESRNDQDVF